MYFFCLIELFFNEFIFVFLVDMGKSCIVWWYDYDKNVNGVGR